MVVVSKTIESFSPRLAFKVAGPRRGPSAATSSADECLFQVVLSLILYVCDHVLELRFAHCEGSVTILPRKTVERGELGVNPGG